MKKLPTFHCKEKLVVAIGRVGSGYTYCVQVRVFYVGANLVHCARPNGGDYIVHRRRDEGITWARGWHTPAARALRTVVLLREDRRGEEA